MIKRYSYRLLTKMLRATVTAKNDGFEVTCEGVWLHKVLQRAGVPSGTDLRGEALSSYVLAEIDPAFTDSQVLLAGKADGQPLFGAHGSFRLVAPKETRGARSVRMLSKLEVVQPRK